MPDYHVGIGLAGIYAGIKKDSTQWKTKSLVTDEVVKAAAQYLLENELNFTFSLNGKRYAMKVTELPDGSL